MNAADDEDDEETAVPPRRALDARDMAAALVRRPGLYIGFPPTRERAEAFMQGFDMALLMTSGEGAPLAQHRDLLQPSSGRDTAATERDTVDFPSLLPVFEELFTAAQSIKQTR